jgi:hypothetical protein
VSIGRLPEEIVRLASGTPLRDGLDRIVSGHTGALIVLGSNEALRAISTGGFTIDVAFTAPQLRELAKMDGAIVLSGDADRILAAGVHLSPEASLPTGETGTRHRTAERVARQVELPVVTVSASMSTISCSPVAPVSSSPDPTNSSPAPTRRWRRSASTGSASPRRCPGSPVWNCTMRSPCATSPTSGSGSR